MALLVCNFQPYTFCRRLDRAGPPCRTRAVRLADGATGARRGENPVPKHSGERCERSELHTHTLTAGRLLPRGLLLDKTLAVLHSPLFAQRTGGADDEFDDKRDRS